MGIFDLQDLNKIRIKDINNLGFTRSYWGSPDWYTPYKRGRNLTRKTNAKPHWNPDKKFYEAYDEERKIVYYYFPKGFSGYVFWGAMGFDTFWKPDLSKTGLIVAYDDIDGDFRWKTIMKEAKSITDFEYIIMESVKRYKAYERRRYR